jgi:hypothetical protein
MLVSNMKKIALLILVLLWAVPAHATAIVCDNSTDNAAAFVSQLPVVSFPIPCTTPALFKTSVNLTNLAVGGVIVHGNGAQVTCGTGANACFDLTGTSGSYWDHLHITANSGSGYTPSIAGFLIARVGGSAAGADECKAYTATGNVFEDVSVCMAAGCTTENVGSSAFYMWGAEQTHFDNCSPIEANEALWITGDTFAHAPGVVSIYATGTGATGQCDTGTTWNTSEGTVITSSSLIGDSGGESILVNGHVDQLNTDAAYFTAYSKTGGHGFGLDAIRFNQYYGGKASNWQSKGSRVEGYVGHPGGGTYGGHVNGPMLELCDTGCAVSTNSIQYSHFTFSETNFGIWALDFGAPGGGSGPPPPPPSPTACPVYIVGSPQQTVAGSGTTAMVVKSSSGVQSGDNIFVYVGTQEGGSNPATTVNTPAGFTLIGGPLATGSNGIVSRLYQRNSNGTDGSTYTFSFVAPVTWVTFGQQITYRGASATPIDGSVTTQNQTSGTSIILPAVSPSGTADLLVAMGQDYGGWSSPSASGMTFRHNANNQAIIFDQLLSASGSTGTRTLTGMSSSVETGFMFALTPLTGTCP